MPSLVCNQGSRQTRFFFLFFFLTGCWLPTPLFSAGGKLTIFVEEEDSGEPTIARLELYRGDGSGRLMPVRRVVPAGFGVVLDRSLEMSLPEGGYQFRVIRGPEYRAVAGNFSLQRESLDEHTLRLPRMIDMLDLGWTSGDCCVLASADSLPLRMASEDLHLAAALGHVQAKPIPNRDSSDPLDNDPAWIRDDVVYDQGLLFYGIQTRQDPSSTNTPPAETASPSSIDQPVVTRLAKLARNDQNVRVAVENPFAWPLPVWLASGRIDGFFVLGDWLRLDREIISLPNGRPPPAPRTEHGAEMGRWAQTIYWNILEAGLRLAPLAGSGDDSKNIPVGYNRLYVTDPGVDYRGIEQNGAAQNVGSSQDWWNAAWRGHSVATNGPMLRPKLEGELPGHTFQASQGESLSLKPEIQLTVRDSVDYLEVVCNGKIHYTARLDEFAKAGGDIPAIEISESSWVAIRVVTQYEQHYRAAISAPWYIDFDGRKRVTKEAVSFFRDWLSEYEVRLTRLPKDQLSQHVPFVRAARAFWSQQLEAVNQQ